MTEHSTDRSGAAADAGAEAPAAEPVVGEEELVREDDTIIGRAFRWSLVVFLVIGGGIGAMVWMLRRPAPEAPVVVVDVEPPRPIEAPVQPPPQVAFTDITTQAGIEFVHTNGARGDKLLPETMGAGCAFLDYDGDGDQDLLFVNATYWPGEAPAGEPLPTMVLYRNDGPGAPGFEDVTAGCGLEVILYGTGVAVGDYDNDGDPDVFITAVGSNRLFRNDGPGTPRFTDVTADAGVAGRPDEWSTSSGFFDYDNDGDLDLFVCNYVRWSREIDFAVDYRLVGIGRAYGPPTNFEGAHPYLYRNNGDGTFTDVSAEVGIQIANPSTGFPVAKALAVVMVDLDRDGDVDLFVANDTVRNFLFRNNGDGTFEEVGAASGVAYDSMGSATGAMGIDVADLRNEGRLAFGVGNFANEMTSLFAAQGDSAWQFTDESIVEGVGGPSRLALSFGLFFFDYDLDGRLDLLQTNGHLEEEINTVQSSQHYRQPAQLFWNAGPEARSCFTVLPLEEVGDLDRPIVGRGAAYADIDGDGDLDVVFTQTGDRALLLRNDQRLDHHWLRVKLVGGVGGVGGRSNRDALGAGVELETAGAGTTPVVQRRQVMPTRSYLSQVELPVTFGLGAADRVEWLRVIWPDGTVQEVTGEIPIDTTLVIEED